MKRLLIVGAGGFGREVLYFLSHIDRGQRDWAFGGFVDDNAHALDGYDYAAKIVSGTRDYVANDADRLLIAIGEPRTKAKVIETLRGRGANFASFVHPTAKVGNNVRLGDGVVICPHVCIPCDADVGAFVHLNTNTTIAHDTVIGEGSTLSGHCDVTGGAKLGREVFLGSRVTVLPNVTVGERARVGAGSIVVRNVEAGTTVFGNPAKRVS
jgi:sugar O-acyltransferase (sialic acid O-acetyltransferase NeuD family)